MSKKSVFILMLALGMTALITNRAISQDEKEAQDNKAQQDAAADMEDQMAQMAEYMKLMQPAEPHEYLQQFVGEWDVAIKMYPGGPGTPAMESTGTSTIKSVLGGRYILEEHKSMMMGMSYEGLGLHGYNNFRNLHTAVWLSNMSTEMLTMTGAQNPETKTITMYGEMDEPGIDVIGRTVKNVLRPVNKDRFIFDIIDLHAGEDYKVFEMTYTRKGTDDEE